MKKFKAIHCRRINPTRTCWRDDDKDRTVKPVLALKFFKGAFCTLPGLIGHIQAGIDPDRVYSLTPCE
ncbi:hypothetical protein D9M70_611530 [compost metagenome]